MRMMRNTESTRYRFWLGSAAALTAAVAFSSNIVLSKLAYDFGANLHALNLVRAVVLLVCLLLAVWLSGARISIKRNELYRCLALGVLLCAEMYLLLVTRLTVLSCISIAAATSRRTSGLRY